MTLCSDSIYGSSNRQPDVKLKAFNHSIKGPVEERSHSAKVRPHALALSLPRAGALRHQPRCTLLHQLWCRAPPPPPRVPLGAGQRQRSADYSPARGSTTSTPSATTRLIRDPSSPGGAVAATQKLSTSSLASVHSTAASAASASLRPPPIHTGTDQVLARGARPPSKTTALRRLHAVAADHDGEFAPHYTAGRNRKGRRKLLCICQHDRLTRASHRAPRRAQCLRARAHAHASWQAGDYTGAPDHTVVPGTQNLECKIGVSKCPCWQTLAAASF